MLSGDIQAQTTQPYPLNVYLHSKGTRNNYQLSLQAKSKDINWRMTGKGAHQWIELQTHEAHTLNGYLNAFVKVYFYPIFKWDINLDIVDLNLRKFNRNWPQQLTIQLKTKGEHKTGESPDFTLTGMLQTQKAYMHIAGEHYQQWNLAWTINVADFSSLLAFLLLMVKPRGTTLYSPLTELVHLKGIGILILALINLPQLQLTLNTFIRLFIDYPR